MTNTEEPLPKVRRVESEEERGDQQLKQATERAAVLQDELIQATDREIQLQVQLNTVQDDLSQLQKWLQHRSDLQRDFEDRERQLQLQLDQTKDDVSQLQTRFEHQSKEFEDYKQRSAPFWEQEMKQRDSRFILLKYRNLYSSHNCFCVLHRARF